MLRSEKSLKRNASPRAANSTGEVRDTTFSATPAAVVGTPGNKLSLKRHEEPGMLQNMRITCVTMASLQYVLEPSPFQVFPHLPPLAGARVALFRPRRRRRNRLSGLEKELKKTLEEKSAALETAERRLTDITEALRSQKQLRVKEMHENQVKHVITWLVQHQEEPYRCAREMLFLSAHNIGSHMCDAEKRFRTYSVLVGCRRGQTTVPTRP